MVIVFVLSLIVVLSRLWFWAQKKSRKWCYQVRKKMIRWACFMRHTLVVHGDDGCMSCSRTYVVLSNVSAWIPESEGPGGDCKNTDQSMGKVAIGLLPNGGTNLAPLLKSRSSRVSFWVFKLEILCEFCKLLQGGRNFECVMPSNVKISQIRHPIPC